jgi:hypothetical protein
MISNSLPGYSRLLLSFAVIATVLGLAGCYRCCDQPVTVNCNCDSTAGYDVVYAFNIPESDADCPDGTHFETKAGGDDGTGGYSGGGGVVDRSGGGGVVDRDGNPILAWCEIDCAPGETVDEFSEPIIVWDPSYDVVVVERICVN